MQMTLENMGLSTLVASKEFKNIFLYIQSKMISKGPSATLRTKSNIENVTAAIGQKDKMIELLRRELEGFRTLRQDYDRLNDRKTKMLDKCDSIKREISLSKDSQNRKATSDLDLMQDISSQVLLFEKELQTKTYHLKALKSQAQTLLASSDQRDADLAHCLDAIEAIKSCGDSLRAERDRLRLQINQAEDQISKVQHSCNQSVSSCDKVRVQIQNTQSFIRNLEDEEGKLANNLSTLEDENNALDSIIEDMGKLIEMTKAKTKDSRQVKQALEYNIKAKQLEKGRLETEHSQKLKKFRLEYEKEKKLKELVETKKSEIQRLSLMNKETIAETEEVLERNLEIDQINAQLKRDLEVCQKHLENVSRVNSSVSAELQKFKKTNTFVIQKLKQPLDEGWAELHVHLKSELAESTSDNFQSLRT